MWPSTAIIVGSRIERSLGAGVSVFGSLATITGSVISDTAPWQGDLFGDGLSIIHHLAPADAELTSSMVRDSARASVSNFSSTMGLGDNTLSCAALDLAGDDLLASFVFEDHGGNRCGCPQPAGPCMVLSPGLTPPTPATPP
ncbi:MAG: hypothetical protein JRI23_09015 [Deltaproteobacteria bacterium]|nr:hypothetical protein [Deltaproteobacteria bacterium]MBW2531778.1 hypothetical protein [Deltaproteobacteria bacterium]